MRAMNAFISSAAIVCATFAAAAAPAVAQPASAPATQQTEPVTLDGGRVIFTPPAELTYQGKRDDDRSAGFLLGENEALITVLVVPQERAVPRGIAPRLAQLITKTIREEAQQGQIDIVVPPRAERDERFLLRMHDKFNTEERFGDRVQMYRAVGLYLVSVTATAFTEDEEEATRAHELGVQLLLSVRLNPRAGGDAADAAQRRAPPRLSGQPEVFENARIRLTPPADWPAEASDNATGRIASYSDPASPTNFITVSVHPLPPEARRDAELRELAIDEIAAAEMRSIRIDDVPLAGETRSVRDRRFLRKTRADGEHEGRRLRLTSRQVRAGDLIVSVTILALEEEADAIDRLADQMAATVRRAADAR